MVKMQPTRVPVFPVFRQRRISIDLFAGTWWLVLKVGINVLLSVIAPMEAQLRRGAIFFFLLTLKSLASIYWPLSH